MSYISTIRKRNEVLVWERDSYGRNIKTYQAPFYFFTADPDGQYTSIFGDKLTKHEFSNYDDHQKAVNIYKGQGIDVFESDISPEQRILSEHYYNATPPPINVTFFDIEVQYSSTQGFAGVNNPYAPINSVAFYHQWLNKYVLVAIPPQRTTVRELREAMNKIEPLPTDTDIEIELVANEIELLFHILNQIEDSDVLSGWNCMPVTQSVWGSDKIYSLKDAPQRQQLLDSTIIRSSDVMQKEEYQIELANGMIISASKDHRFPVRVATKTLYTNLQPSRKTENRLYDTELTVREIQDSTDTVFLQLKVRENTLQDNPNITNEQAYLAGLIYTDGTLHNKNVENCSYIIYQSDKEMLQKLPLTETAIVGPHLGCYARGVRRDMLGEFTRNLIYTSQKEKKLNLELLSTLSYTQFMFFLSGLLDGDGYKSGNTYEWCNYNNDAHTLSELCLWNGILTSIKEDKFVRFIHINDKDLHLLKNKRWYNFSHSNTARIHRAQAKDIKFRTIGDTHYIRVKSVKATNKIVDMLDLETSTHYFYSKGIKTHNSEFFDLPYIAKRLEKINPKLVNGLSFPGAFTPRWAVIEKRGQTNSKIILSGRVALDYLDLYRKYEMGDRPSYKLESIADDVLPDMPKLEYEGSLAKLYETNFPYFLRYNLRDTEILKGFEDRLGYVALANTMVHISTAMFENAMGTIKLSELAICNYCWHELEQRVPDIARPESKKIQGALVLDPKVGMHEWIGSVDISSLYPSAIRSINISPETIIGQFNDDVKASEEIAKKSISNITLVYEDGRKETHSASEWRQILHEHKWAVSGYGTVFDQNTQGIIPTILEGWYNTRKEYQALKKNTDNKLQTAHYDRLQYTYKIKLNSLYGALSNRFFRFFDPRMGESTTGTGRLVLQHQCCQVNKLLTGDYNLYGDAIIGGDTDSTYFKTFALNKDEAVQVADAIATAVNKSYPAFMCDTFLCQPGYDNIIQCGREIVSDRGIFVEKKRYILHVVDNEGIPTDKLKIMGLDTKKTTLPKIVSARLNGYIERLLKGETWDSVANGIVEYKDALMQNENVQLIGLPKGIKGLEQYAERYEENKESNLPGHVAAAICYNLCLNKFNDKESIPITSGMKLKIFYLTHTLFGRFKSIAIPTDIEVIPNWFYEACRVDKKKHITRLVDNPIRNIIKAINKIPPSKQERMFSSIVGDDILLTPDTTSRNKKNEPSKAQAAAILDILGVGEAIKEPLKKSSKSSKNPQRKHKQNKLLNDIFGDF